MKTLDEVIVELENYPVVGGTTLTFDVIVVPERSLNNALHYLKEYKNTDENYKRAISHVTEVIDHYEKMVADYLSVNNPPLTWEELKAMEGKPVWVEMEGYKHNRGIVMNQDERNGRLLLCGYDKVAIRIEINKEGEGNRWQAYRKENK